jgi:hypothetical protein
MDTIEEVETRDKAQDRERFWIQEYIDQGADLLNIQALKLKPVEQVISDNQDKWTEISLPDPDEVHLLRAIADYNNPRTHQRVKEKLLALGHIQLDEAPDYHIQHLIQSLPISRIDLDDILQIPIRVLDQILSGAPTSKERADRILRILSWIYSVPISPYSVHGLHVQPDRYPILDPKGWYAVINQRKMSNAG